MDKLFVVNSNGEKSDFQHFLITKAIIDETGLDNDKAERIKKSIAKKLNKLKREDGLNEVSTSTIRAEVSSQLLKIGEVDAEKKSRKLGMSVSQYEQVVHDGDRQNANKNYSPEMIQLYAAPTAEALTVLKAAMEKFNLSARAYSRILKVARTIADLDNSETVEKKHIQEAVMYRSLDRSYWGEW